jgi:hypothetical protein
MKSSLHSLILHNCTADSQLTQLAWDPRYVASGRTQQKTLFPSNDRCLQSHSLATGIYVTVSLEHADCYKIRVFLLPYSQYKNLMVTNTQNEQNYMVSVVYKAFC